MSLPPDIASRFVSNPLYFTRYFWPDMLLYGKQKEILLSVRDNIETHVHAGTTLGKDRTAAICALWFYTTRNPARVIIISSTWTQLRDSMWGEITNLLRMARDIGRPLPVIVQDMVVKKPGKQKGETETLDVLRCMSPDTEEGFGGRHLDGSKGPKMLFIMSEASDIKDEFKQAADSQRHRLLATGNPLATSGWFYNDCMAGDAANPVPGTTNLFRHVIHIDGERDSPNVVAGKQWYEAGNTGPSPTIIPGVLSYPEYKLMLAGGDAYQICTRLRGRFWDAAESKLFPFNALDAAQKLGARLRAEPRRLWRGPRAMGIDVGAGGDWTVWTVIGRYGVIDKVRKQTKNTAEVRGITIRLMRKWKIPPEYVAIDAGGGGKEHADALRDDGYEVMAIGFGSVADIKEEYKTMRAELYGQAAKAMAIQPHTRLMLARPTKAWRKAWTCLSIPPDDNLLRQDLAVMPRLYDGEGKLRLPPKDRQGKVNRHQGTGEKTIREMLGRSPDDADSFVLAWYAFQVAMDIEGADRRTMAF